MNNNLSSTLEQAPTDKLAMSKHDKWVAKIISRMRGINLLNSMAALAMRVERYEVVQA
jgi:hypothetical protein